MPVEMICDEGMTKLYHHANNKLLQTCYAVSINFTTTLVLNLYPAKFLKQTSY